MRRHVPSLVIATLVLAVSLVRVPSAEVQAQPQPEYGPAHGTLVIVGGGSTNGTGIVEKFIEPGGGPDGKFVIVPASGGNFNADGIGRQYITAR